MRPHRQEKDMCVRLKVSNNMIKLVSRGYIMELVILALTYFFSVTKVTDDICMVYNANLRGLN